MRAAGLSAPAPGWAERDDDALWREVAAAVRAVLRLAGDAQVVAVGVCGHSDGAYLVDGGGRLTRPGIAATDRRAAADAAALAAGADGERVLALTGQVPFAASPAALLHWLARSEPAAVDAARWLLSCKDVVRLRLTGEVATDATDASASFTGVRSRDWSEPALQALRCSEFRRLLPPVLPADEVAGTVTRAAAAATGLAVGTPVVTGCHDVDAAALGCGADAPGAWSAVLGTFSINQVVAAGPVLDRAWQSRAFLREDRWLHMATSPRGAGVVETAAALLGVLSPDGAADAAGAVALGLTVPPDRALAAPLFRPDTLAWSPPDDAHGPAELLHAVLEGVAFTHRAHLEQLRRAFAPDRPLRLCGGGARSPGWSRLLADVVQQTVEVTDAEQAGARGAALLAGSGAGVLGDPGSTAREVVRVLRTHEPDDGRWQHLAPRYERFLAAPARDAAVS